MWCWCICTCSFLPKAFWSRGCSDNRRRDESTYGRAQKGNEGKYLNIIVVYVFKIIWPSIEYWTNCIQFSFRFIFRRFAKHPLLLNDGCQRKEKLHLKQILIVFTTNILLQQKMCCLTIQVWLQVMFDTIDFTRLQILITLTMTRLHISFYFTI